jgi:phosphonate metabolism protein (transferase hexapeptide repeat family)
LKFFVCVVEINGIRVAEMLIGDEACEFGFCCLEQGPQHTHGQLNSMTIISPGGYCDRYSDIANARIGKFADIAAFARIGATDHPLHTASCHHFLYRSADYWDDAELDDAFFEHRRLRLVHIGHDTWIGAGAVILPEVTLGHGAVVAAGAVVTKDVAPYTIVAGTPAQPRRRRQPSEIADKLIDLAWWDWPHEALREALADFRHLSAEAFIEKYS